MTVTAEDGSTTQTYTVTVTRAGAGITVTIEAEHESIGGGVEDLKFTLTRTGATTDALTVTVTLTQDQNWLTSTYLTHEVEFAAGEATKELIIEDDDFSFDPTTSGNLVATVTGTGVAGGTDTVVVISIADPPITIAFDQDAYIFPEGGPADDVEIYVTATLDAAFPREPSSSFDVGMSTGEGTATGPEDYDEFSRNLLFTPSDFTANSNGQLVASLLVGPSVRNPLVIVDDDVYEVDETFNIQIELPPGFRTGLARAKKADGTFCVLGPSGCTNVPYPVTITDDLDLPTLSLAAVPTSIAEEDDATTTGTVENVSTLTVSIGNAKTFAADQTLTLTFFDATYGTHYTVTPADTDGNTTGHQVTLTAGQTSVDVTVTAAGNTTADGNRSIIVFGSHAQSAFGTTIELRDDETPTAQPAIQSKDLVDMSEGNTSSLAVTLSIAPTSDRLVGITSDDTGAVTVTPSSLTFTSANWDVEQWLDISAVQDSDSDDEDVTLTLSGTGLTSKTVTVTVRDDDNPPDAPTSLTAAADGQSEIDLSWTEPTNDGGSDITGYRIEVSPNGTSSWTDLVPNTNSTSTTYGHTGLAPGTTRHYRVSAINSVGTGTASNVANATTDDAAPTVPGAPTGLSATADGTSTIDLDWTAPTDNGGSDVTGYRIEVSSNGSSGWSNLEANTNSTTYAHTGLSAGDTRHYRVSAINSVGTGDASRTANATTDDAAPTVPGAPTGLSATADGTSTIDLDWTAPSDDGGASITGYRIEVSSNGSSGWSNLEANTNSTPTTYAHTGLSAGDTRHYRVSAINSVGTGTASNTANATTATTVPGAPTSLTATASGTTTINLDWTAPVDDGGASISGYKIEVSPNGNSKWTERVGNTGTTTASYSHTGLSAGTTRYYRVSAINTNGTGTASNTANATTATTVPGAPTSLTATASGSKRINLSWTEPTDDGGASITGYRIEVSPNGTSNWTERVGNTNSTGTTYAHTGLSAGDTRYYRVSAINATGTGTASNTADATTGTDPGPLVLTVQAVSATVTEGEPVRYRILMSRPTSGALVESEYSYEGEFVRNGPASVVTGVSSQNGMTYWEIGYETLDDAMVEEDGSFTVRIRKPPDVDLGEAYTLGTPRSATVTILDNDHEETPELPIVSVEDARVKEGPDAELAFPVRLNVAAVETATIEWETLNGAGNKGAKAGKDYKADKGTLVFSPGEKEKTIRVEVIDDEKHEGTEVMLLMLLDAQGAEIDDAVAKGTIEDDDAASAAAAAADDALEDALTLVDDLTPDVAAAVLLGEQTLGEAELAALDRLGNGNGRYDLGDLLAWIERCRRGEARCGPTSTGSGPPSAAGLLAAAAAGRLWISRRTRRRGSGRPERKSIRAARRRGRFAGYALATLLAVTMTLSCTEGSVGPAAYVQDPGFLTVEWTGPAAGRGIGVLLELEGPGIEAVRAPGFELYESRASGRHEIVVAGSLRAGPLVQFRVPDRGQLPLYRVRVLEVAGEDYELRDAGEYRAVITLH